MSNRLELVNETLTTACTYSLVTFSSFVPDADTRYTCGWPLVGVVFLMIGINLSVIIYLSIGKIASTCRLHYKRHQNRKLFQKKVKAYKKNLKRQKELNERRRRRKTGEKFMELEKILKRPEHQYLRQQGFAMRPEDHLVDESFSNFQKKIQTNTRKQPCE